MGIDSLLPEQIRKEISLAADILMKEGCREVYLFGSLASGSYTEKSDIDIATVGLPKQSFFSAYGKLLSFIERPVDLVPLDYDTDFGRMLIEKGVLTRVA